MHNSGPTKLLWQLELRQHTKRHGTACRDCGVMQGFELVQSYTLALAILILSPIPLMCLLATLDTGVKVIVRSHRTLRATSMQAVCEFHTRSKH